MSGHTSRCSCSGDEWLKEKRKGGAVMLPFLMQLFDGLLLSPNIKETGD